MKWFALFSPIALACAYGLYFILGLASAPSDWSRLEQSFVALDKVQAKAAVRKGVTKHIFYSKNNVREVANLQAQDSTLYLLASGHSLQLQEELEGVFGTFWDIKKQHAYHLYMPYALCDYRQKNISGYQAKLEEFDAVSNLFIAKSDFAEIECSFKEEPSIKLKRIHAEVFKDP